MQYRADKELIQACLAGDQDAWNLLVKRYGRLVYSIPRRYGLSEADADDVFQSVFTILFRKLPSIRDQTRSSAWLIRTTHRECYRIAKRSRRDPEIDRTTVDVSGPSDEQALAWERQHLVRQALHRLGGRCEQLLTALFLSTGPPNYKAIAEQLGMKVGTIGPARARCFEKMETILIEMGITEEVEERA